MISVFHNDHFMDWGPGSDISQFDLQLVAQVNTKDLDKAFQLTNSIGTGWWLENQGPDLRVNHDSLKRLKGFRSTSTGDVLTIVETSQWYVVAAIGFREIFPFLKEKK